MVRWVLLGVFGTVFAIFNAGSPEQDWQAETVMDSLPALSQPGILPQVAQGTLADHQA